MARILIIQQQSAWSNAQGREAQDMCLALAATDHQVSILYRDSAVLQLSPLHSSTAVKDYTAAQKLFDLYDIEAVYACQSSLKRFQLTPKQLRIQVTQVGSDEQRALLAMADRVMVY